MTSIPPAVSLVADALLAAFRRAAFRRIEASTAKQVDNKQKETDGYVQLLTALAHLAKHAPTRVIQAIVDWRIVILREAPKGGSEFQLQRRKVLTEQVFWETVERLLGPPPGVVISATLSNLLEELAFEHALLWARIGLEQPGMPESRTAVTDHICASLGILSRLRFDAIVSRFLKEMHARVRVESTVFRAEVTSICRILHGLRIGLSNQQDLVASTAFLNNAHPLRWTPPKKKSEVQHAVAELLTKVLRSAVGQALAADAGSAGAVRMWFEAVGAVRDELSAWVKSNERKHTHVGYPLITVLLCLGDSCEEFESFMEKSLGRALKDSKYRKTSLECLHLLLLFYLRSKGRGWHFDTMWGRIQATLMRLMNYLLKAAFSVDPHRDVMVTICTTAVEIHPEFAFEHLILELLRAETLGDHTIIGLRSMLAVVEGTSAAQAMAMVPDLDGVTQQSEAESEKGEALDRLLKGEDPILLFYGQKAAQCMPQFRDVLGHIMTACHVTYGQALLTLNRPIADLVPKEKLGAMVVLRWVLRLVPFLTPEEWTGRKIAETLPWYTIHVDASIRQEALSSLVRTMYAVPGVRVALIFGMASLVLRIPDEQHGLVQESLQNTIVLLREWEERMNRGMQVCDADVAGEVDPGDEQRFAGSSVLRVRLEAAGLVMLCTSTSETRHSAVSLLRATRRWHKTLKAFRERLKRRTAEGVARAGSAAQSPIVYVMDALEMDHEGAELSAGCEAMEWGRKDPILLDFLSGDAALANGQHREPLLWSSRISRLATQLSYLCPETVQFARPQVMARHKALLVSGEPPNPESDPDRFHDWRNYIFFLCSSAPHSNESSTAALAKEVFRMLVPMLRTSSSVYPETCQVSVAMALGRTHPGSQELLFEEIGPIDEWFADKPNKSKGRRKDATYIATMLRLLAEGSQPGPELRRACPHYVSFIDVMARMLNHQQGQQQSSLPEHIPLDELLHLRHTMCVVITFISAEAVKVIPSQYSPALRAQLFQLFGAWCDESEAARVDMERAQVAALAKVKDPVERAGLEAELTRQAESVYWAAIRGRACLLIGPPFDNDVRKPTGWVLGWITSLFVAQEPPKTPAGMCTQPWRDYTKLARMSLLNLLQVNTSATHPQANSNVDLFSVCVDFCYVADARVSNGYFSVLAEVFLRSEVVCNIAVLLSLIIYKVGDSNVEVCEEAAMMLQHVASKQWGRIRSIQENPTLCGVPGSGVLCGLSGNYQYQLSDRLAKDHPSISEQLCMEMMQRQLDTATMVAGHRFILCMRPWLENVSFTKLRESDLSARLLKGLFYITMHNGKHYPTVIESLWSTVASKVRNVIPVLDFLISKCMENVTIDNVLTYLNVAKSITLYFARVSPQHTIDQLVYEISQRIYEDPKDSDTSSSNIQCQVVKFPEVTWSADGAAAVDPPRASWKQDRHVQYKTADLLNSERRVGPGGRVLDVRASGLQESNALYLHSKTAPTNMVLPLSRADLAVVLLAEVAGAHDEDFRSHLPVLLHVIVVSMDGSEGVVCQHMQQLLINLIHSLSVKPLEQTHPWVDHPVNGGTSNSKTSALVDYLQSSKGHLMWAKEDGTLGQPRIGSAAALGTMVEALIECMVFDGELREQWGSVASSWAIQCNNQHLACRSHQVYRALSPKFTVEAFQNILHSIYLCLGQPKYTILSFAMEAILSLQLIVSNLNPKTLILYPQIFWACIAMLCTPFVQVYVEAMSLFGLVLKSMPMDTPTVQHVLLASKPVIGPAFCTDRVYLLILKGLTSSNSQSMAVKLLVQIGLQTSDAIFGAAGPRRVSTVVCTLPWMYSELALVWNNAGRANWGIDSTVTNLQNVYCTSLGLIQVCRKAGHLALADAFLQIAADIAHALQGLEFERKLPTGLSPAAFLERVSSPLCEAFFPRYTKSACGQMMVLLQTVNELEHGKAILHIVSSWLRHGCLASCSALYRHSTSALFSPVAKLVESPLAEHALILLDLLMSNSAQSATGEGPSQEWKNPVPWCSVQSHKVSVEFLGVIREGFGSNVSKHHLRNPILPFLPLN